MKAPPFRYHRAESLEDAVAARADLGAGSRVLAGGQTLLWHMKFRLVEPSALIDIGAVEELSYVAGGNGHIRIGAMARQRDVERSEVAQAQVPLLCQAIRHVATVPVRHRGTVVGSVAAATPYAEISAAAVALDGEVELVGSGGSRTLPVEEFLVGTHETALRNDEVVKELRLKRPPAGAGSAFVEMSRTYHNRAVVGAGVVVSLEDGRIASAAIGLCNAAPTAMRLREAEQALIGQQPSPELFASVATDSAAGLEPPTDEQASSGYRKRLARVLVQRALTQATTPQESQ
jgi:aerobic carbon-monoxide dehydrogenase medium subunit